MGIITKTIEKRWNDLSESAQRQAIKSGRIDPCDYWDVHVALAIAEAAVDAAKARYLTACARMRWEDANSIGN